jgi:hypothetical protein
MNSSLATPDTGYSPEDCAEPLLFPIGYATVWALRDDLGAAKKEKSILGPATLSLIAISV